MSILVSNRFFTPHTVADTIQTPQTTLWKIQLNRIKSIF